MGFLKEKSAYRATRTETVLAWFFTAASGIFVALWLWKPCAP